VLLLVVAGVASAGCRSNAPASVSAADAGHHNPTPMSIKLTGTRALFQTGKQRDQAALGRADEVGCCPLGVAPR
jgi:hypothetical protein